MTYEEHMEKARKHMRHAELHHTDKMHHRQLALIHLTFARELREAGSAMVEAQAKASAPSYTAPEGTRLVDTGDGVDLAGDGVDLAPDGAGGE